MFHKMPQPSTPEEELLGRIQRLEADVVRLSTHDHLTGLLTKAAFVEELSNFLPEDQTPQTRGAMVEIALRNIPRMSGMLGRHVSDYVISAIAARLLGHETGISLKARLDHSTFAIYLPSEQDALELLGKTKKMIAHLAQPVDWIDRKLYADVVAGAALVRDCQGDISTLVNNAGLAASAAATQKGELAYSIFTPALAQTERRRNDVYMALQTALERNCLSMRFQPCYHSKTQKLSSLEALMRFNCTEIGEVGPSEFIPIAEETGLISKIGAWALVQSCQIATLMPKDLVMAVNVSPEQIYGGTLVSDVHNALELSGFDPNRLELEITENTLMKDSEAVIDQLNALRDMGCRIVLDDFGIGYSSLSYLWQFPFSKLKIDRGFIRAMDATPLAKGVLQSIVGLAKTLGLEITVEGIETEAQSKVLTELGAHYLQGYLFSMPLPETELAALFLREIGKPGNERSSNVFELKTA